MFKLNKVLLLDGISPVCGDILTKNGIDVTTKVKLTKEELIQELKVHDAVIVRSATKVTEEVLNQTSVKVVGRAGTGVDNIDTKAATAKGVLVMNTPGGNTLSAAEHTCALICSLSREIPLACQSLKEGKWDRKKFMGNELNGKTLAIVGLGRIGQEVASRMRSFGMSTIGFDPLVSVEQAQAFGVEWMTLDNIWPRADYITVHVPLIPQTRDLIGETSLKACKPTVRILNVARGGIVNEDALLKGLKEGRVAGAALDVYEQEPPTNVELLQHPKIICTPHLGANTHEAQIRVAEEIAQQFVQMSEGGEIVGAVNAPQLRLGQNVPKGWERLAVALGKMARVIGGGLNVGLNIKGSLAKQILPAFEQNVIVGYMAAETSGINLINAKSMSSVLGLTVSASSTDGESATSACVTVDSMTFEGCVANGQPVLTGIKGLSFPYGLQLSGDVAFVSTKEPRLLVTKADFDFHSMSMAKASGDGSSWISFGGVQVDSAKLVFTQLDCKAYFFSFYEF